MYFDNTNYYELNGDATGYKGTLASQFNNGYSMYIPEEGGYSSISPAEFSLIGEFRITDVNNVDMDIHMNHTVQALQAVLQTGLLMQIFNFLCMKNIYLPPIML